VDDIGIPKSELGSKHFGSGSREAVDESMKGRLEVSVFGDQAEDSEWDIGSVGGFVVEIGTAELSFELSPLDNESREDSDEPVRESRVVDCDIGMWVSPAELTDAREDDSIWVDIEGDTSEIEEFVNPWFEVFG
jgi:hypothetical protein